MFEVGASSSSNKDCEKKKVSYDYQLNQRQRSAKQCQASSLQPLSVTKLRLPFVMFVVL